MNIKSFVIIKLEAVVDPISRIFGVVSQAFVQIGSWLKELSTRVAAIAEKIFSREQSPSNPLDPDQVKPLDGSSGNPGIEKIQRNVFKNVMAPHLSVQDLAALSQSSRALHNIVGPILAEEKKLEEAATRIGPDIWKQIGFEVKEVPQLPKDIDAILKAKCPYFEGKRVYQTHRLLLMPAGLSINKQGVLTKNLREGAAENIFRTTWDRITQELGQQKIEKSYWVLVTKDIIPTSRGKPFKSQKGLLREGYEIPTTLEAMTLVTMNLVKSGKRPEFLLPLEPISLTHCIEEVDGISLVVGGFARSGLIMRNYDPNDENVGVLAVRRLVREPLSLWERIFSRRNITYKTIA